MTDAPKPQNSVHQDSKTRLAFKDYLTLTLSALAFLASTGTAYVNVVQTSDAILLVDVQEPFVSLEKGRLLLRPESEGRVSLINSGNQTAIVILVTLFYLQPASVDAKPSCAPTSASVFETDFRPVVLKPNEAIVRTIKATRPQYHVLPGPRDSLELKNGTFPLPIAQHNIGAKAVLIDVCIYFEISTPSTYYRTDIIPSSRLRVQDGLVSWDPVSDGYLTKPPYALIKRIGTIFSR